MGLQNTLKALADPIRREILNLLREGRMSAGDIVEKFPVTGASISRHLSVLKDADLIRASREGKFIYYELNTSVLEEIMLWITDLKGADLDEGNGIPKEKEANLNKENEIQKEKEANLNEKKEGSDEKGEKFNE